MIAAIIIVLLVATVVTVVTAGALRRVVQDEAEAERRIEASEGHVLYEVPNGVDPGEVRVALTRAGFPCAGSGYDLVVKCDQGERERLRHVIANLHETAYDGSALVLGPVVFEDEKKYSA